jgi:DNA-binding transcriptional LysR family regulator
MNLISLDIRVLRSLLAVIESGSVTEAARRLGRTQPAITLQLQRLEELIGKPLFTHEGRRMSLTPDGETVVTYARSILRLHDELLARMLSPDIQGDVVLGTPDLYAAFMLPDILAVFRRAFPHIKIELRCSLSTPLVQMVQKRQVDIALVTRMNDFTGGQVVRREQLLWMAGMASDAHNENPVPLALLPPDNIYRDLCDRMPGTDRTALACSLRKRKRKRKRQRLAGRGVLRHGGHCPRPERPRRRNEATVGR